MIELQNYINLETHLIHWLQEGYNRQMLIHFDADII